MASTTTTPPRPARLPSFGWQMAGGMAAGVALGLGARAAGGDTGWLAEALHLIGQSFVQLLKALVAPLVFAAIVGSVAALRDLEGAAQLVGKTLLWFAGTALIAVLVGITLGIVIQPGLHAGIVPGTAAAPATSGSWLDFIKGLIPGNMLGLAAATKQGEGGLTTSLSFNILQIIVIAAAMGAAAVRVGEAGAPFLAFNTSLLAIMRRLLRWVIALAPVGAAGLMGDAIVRYGWHTLSSLGAFAGAVYLGLAIVMLVVYPGLLAVNGLSPVRFYRAAWPAIQLAFLSRSTIATLPVTEDVAEHALHIPRRYAAFAVPLAATTKMDGCASIYPAIAAIFIAQFFGLSLDPGDYVLIAFVSVVGSAATAGLTGATVMLTLTLSTLGLPLDGVGLLLAIDPIIDMGRTAVNVTGQLLVPLIVATRAGLMGEAELGGAQAETVSPHSTVTG